jgi:hypothetical protein
MNLNLKMPVLPFGNKKKDEEEIIDEFDISDIQDQQKNLEEENQMFSHPVFRGYTFLNNCLESVSFEEYAAKQTEIQIKLRICKVFEHFINARQDYLLSNFLTFFKRHVVPAASSCELGDVIKQFGRNLLPNIQKTGFNDIDDTYKPADKSKDKENSTKQ